MRFGNSNVVAVVFVVRVVLVVELLPCVFVEFGVGVNCVLVDEIVRVVVLGRLLWLVVLFILLVFTLF